MLTVMVVACAFVNQPTVTLRVGKKLDGQRLMRNERRVAVQGLPVTPAPASA